MLLKRKGLKEKVCKTKVMVSGEGGVKVVSKVDPCGVCDKREKANSILCVVCNKWVHKRCSGVKGGLQKFAGTFQCKRFTGGAADVIAEEYCVIEGIGRVASFVYLGDELDSGGGCDGKGTCWLEEV